MGGAQVGDGEFGVVFEGVEGFVAEEISRLPRSRRRFVVEMIENALGSR